MEFAELFESTYFGKCMLTFLMAMVPVIELRGAIPMGISLGIPGHIAMLLSIAGSLIPVPFIIVFIRRIFMWMRKKSKRLGRLADRFERKAKSKGASLYRSELIGLLIFVAIPLPGTGAWTGSLIAAIFNIRLKNALPAIAAGVVLAGIIVTAISHGFKLLLT